jgi:very-short-patch-repair endonuclease
MEFYTHQYMSNIEHSYQCDIFIPSKNMIIECDGDYWHNYPVGRPIDHIRTQELEGKNYKVLRLWERDIKTMTLEEFKQKIEYET